ncbi:MAG: hypothetical protein JXR44_06860 [Thiotrichales bacterium]|nr:hypothetical protein [Thiotrichales bacterium]
MVKRLLILCMVLFQLPLQAATVKLSSDQVFLGEPLIVRLISEPGESLDSHLAQLPVQEWAKEFVLELHSNQRNQAAIYLYPYQSGVFSLAAGGDFVGSHVRVLDNPNIKVQWQAKMPQRMYPQQQGFWQAQVQLSQPDWRVQMQSFVANPWQTNPERLRQPETLPALLAGELQGVLRVPHTFATDLSVTSERVPQRLTLYSPVLEVRSEQSKVWKFFDRPQTVWLEPLPEFIVPNPLIGQIKWQQTAPPSWLPVGAVGIWQWQLQGVQMAPIEAQSALRALLAQLPRTEEVEWFAPTIEQDVDNQGGWRIQIPIRLGQSGQVVLPSWSWRFFDPESGKVDVRSLPGPTIWTYAPWQAGLFWLLIFFLGGLLSFTVWVLGRFYWQRYRVIQLLSTGQISRGQRQLWQLTAEWLGQPPIQNWQQWQKALGISEELAQQIYRALYAPAPPKDSQALLSLLQEHTRTIRFDSHQFAREGHKLLALWQRLRGRQRFKRF